MRRKWIVMILDCAVRCASCGDEERRKRKCFNQNFGVDNDDDDDGDGDDE